jgi:hypothetical protein
MAYKVTFEPLNRIRGVTPTTVEIATASEAWKEVDGLMMSDEKVKIIGPQGIEISWEELKAAADKESA